MVKQNRVIIETGSKKSFASALDWPGWSRAGRSEQDAIGNLIAYASRYRKVIDRAGVVGIDEVIASANIIERVAGGGVTDFGVPDRVADADHSWMSPTECDRQIAILEACWDEFDAVAARVSPELQKGPRGGGRDRDAIMAHTYKADSGYRRRIGVATPPGHAGTAEELAKHREDVVATIREINASKSSTKWPLRYYMRRAAWHLLDHAWELEDKDLSNTKPGRQDENSD